VSGCGGCGLDCWAPGCERLLEAQRGRWREREDAKAEERGFRYRNRISPFGLLDDAKDRPAPTLGDWIAYTGGAS
jgi:hypothetical protein